MCSRTRERITFGTTISPKVHLQLIRKVRLMFRGRHNISRRDLMPEKMRRNIFGIVLEELLSDEDKRLIRRYNELTIGQKMSHNDAILKIAKEKNKNPNSLRRTIRRIQSIIKYA